MNALTAAGRKNTGSAPKTIQGLKSQRGPSFRLPSLVSLRLHHFLLLFHLDFQLARLQIGSPFCFTGLSLYPTLT